MSTGDSKDSPHFTERNTEARQKKKSNHMPSGCWKQVPEVLGPVSTHSILAFIPTSADSTRNGPVPAKASSRASPSVAVNLHHLSRGILFALMEAGTPFQGHTSVFMPDLRESNQNVLGDLDLSDLEPCWEGSLSPRPDQGTHGQGRAWWTRCPSMRILPGSTEDSLTTVCPHSLLGAL